MRLMRQAAVIVAYSAFLFFGGLSVKAQSSIERRIEIGRGNIADPIRIEGIYYDGQPVKANIAFRGPDDWLAHVSVRVQNVSNKSLIAGNVRVGFRELGDPMLIQVVPFGRYPDHQMFTREGSPVLRSEKDEAVSIPPGKTVTIYLAKRYKEINQSIAQRGSVAQVSSCWIDLGSFYFPDGTKWSAGTFAQEDPARPAGYIPITKDEFNRTPK